NDKDTHVESRVKNESLQVDDTLHRFQCLEHPPGQVALGNAYHAAPFGAKERLYDDVAAQGDKGVQGVIGLLAGDGVRDRKARLTKLGGAQIFVNAGLQGARTVDATHPLLLEPLQ